VWLLRRRRRRDERMVSGECPVQILRLRRGETKGGEWFT
jgi:hypothetical protein